MREMYCYVRDDLNRKIGVVLADEKGRIGFSLLHTLDSNQNRGPHKNWDNNKAIGLARQMAKRFDATGRIQALSKMEPPLRVQKLVVPKLIWMAEQVQKELAKENPSTPPGASA